MTLWKKGHRREEAKHVWGCGQSPYHHMYVSLPLEGGSFSAFTGSDCYKWIGLKSVSLSKWSISSERLRALTMT